MKKIETEIKIKVDDFNEIEELLKSLEFVLVRKELQENLFLDDSANSLRLSNKFLRLRFSKFSQFKELIKTDALGRDFKDLSALSATIKDIRPISDIEGVTNRTERTLFDRFARKQDLNQWIEFFKFLGYEEKIRYGKMRKVYSYVEKDISIHLDHICDIGSFVEIEGKGKDEDDILKIKDMLGLNGVKACEPSYFEMFSEVR